MCGVAAIWHHSGGPRTLDPAELSTLNDSMAKRGPDDSGTWVGDEGRIGLAHRRLAIIGLGEQGHQPMVMDRPCLAAAGGRIVISFNGEIYNYAELRQQLSAAGHHLRTGTDTEVVTRFRRIFALAFWDCCTRRSNLGRDELDIKPIHRK